MIYLDNNATTKPLPAVVEAVAECGSRLYANPSSVHQFGQLARHRVECARAQVAASIGANAKEIVFTSGGTESINLAIHGALQHTPQRRRIVTTAVEHAASLRVAESLARKGYDVVYVGVEENGQIDENAWEAAITEDTAVVSFLHANNETGVLFDVAKLAAIAENKGAVVHVDAVQSAGKIPICVSDWPVHLVSLAGHKCHGPKGVGALYVKRRTRLTPQILGGTQERSLRGGTENVAGIVGMGVACGAFVSDMDAVATAVRQLRDTFESRVKATIPIARVIAESTGRLHNTSNIGFKGLEAEAILILLSEAGICASAGSACSSGSLELSHVLSAMGIDHEVAHGAVRFSFSRFNTPDEVETVAGCLPDLLSRLTDLSRPTTSLRATGDPPLSQ